MRKTVLCLLKRERWMRRFWGGNRGYIERMSFRLEKNCFTGLTITYDAKDLDFFVEWKMMGVRDYVLGLECGNAYPDGRDVMRENGILKSLKPGEKKTYRVTVSLTNSEQ